MMCDSHDYMIITFECVDPIVAKNSGFCSDSGAGVQNGESMTQVIFESCVTVH